MKESNLKAALVGFAIALPLTEFAVRHSKQLSIDIAGAIVVLVLLGIWYAGRHDLKSWTIRALTNVALGAVIFDNFLRGARERPHSFLEYLDGCAFLAIYVVLSVTLFGPERFRREPAPKPPFSLLGN